MNTLLKSALPASRQNRAFTLIELLIVVAIIAILIAILVPALGRAREYSRFVTCKANLRSQLQAHTMYAANFADQKPPLVLPSLSPMGNPLKFAFNAPDTRWVNRPVGQGILAANSAYCTFDLLLCPSSSLSLDRQIDKNNWNDPTAVIAGSSYTYYWRDPALIKSPSNWKDPVTYRNCAATGHSAMIMDINLEAGHNYAGEYAGRAWYAHPLMAKTNIGYIDGSVSSAPNTQVILRYPAGDFEQTVWWADAEKAK